MTSLPATTPAYGVNNVCGSGLQAVIVGSQSILAGNADLVVVGATESATYNPRLTFSLTDVSVESLESDGLFCALAEKSMGVICESLAKDNNVSRKEQDEYTAESHRRACAARDTGKFGNEIIPVKDFDRDEHPRTNTSMEKLGHLPAVFSGEGTITAGNAASPSDGACAFLLASQKAVEKDNLSPVAKILGYASIAVDADQVFSKGTKAYQISQGRYGPIRDYTLSTRAFIQNFLERFRNDRSFGSVRSGCLFR